MNRLQRMIIDQKNNKPSGVYSICSAHSYVLESCMQNAVKSNGSLLIEATSNQVNQLGGYTGQRPLDFVKWIKQLSQKHGLNWENITLGGDHLGPTPWQNLPSTEALKRSEEIVYEYAATGFQKIHLDASMPLMGDEIKSFDKATIAKRTSRLALAAEKAIKDHEIPQLPYYVIGSDVPIAGGMQEGEEIVSVSSEHDVEETMAETKKEFLQAGLTEARQRVIALVVR